MAAAVLDPPRVRLATREPGPRFVFDEIQDVLAVPGADGKIRSVIQHQASAATYAFVGSAPGVMQQLFAAPRRPLLDQAVRRHLDPLPLDDVAETAAAVGIKRTSIRAALDSLITNADVIGGGARPRLTDPMFEHWLQTRGLTPPGYDDAAA